MQGTTYVFMNMTTYEEVRVPRDEVWAKWLQEGVDCDLQFFDGVVISVDPPKNMTVKVRSCTTCFGDRTGAARNRCGAL